MSNNKSNINFHETFSPDFEYIAKILEIADNYDYITKEEISDITGIPTGVSTGKVEPHIAYCEYMNLIKYNKKNGKYNIIATNLGKLILLEDPYFLEDITKRACNYFLTSNISGAPMWSEIVRKISNKYKNNIKETVVIKDLEDTFPVKINLSPFRTCYKSDKSLGDLNVLKFNEDSKEKIIYFNENKYDLDYIYLYAYCLIKDLEDFDNTRKEFTIDEVLEKIIWNRGFNWDNEVAINIIDKINDLGIIKENKQLNPVTLIINTTSNEILEKIYSLL